jgi:hypothetical protein
VQIAWVAESTPRDDAMEGSRERLIARRVIDTSGVKLGSKALIVRPLIYREYSTLCSSRRERFLIHNLNRVTLWTSPNFLSGSSALAIGYFLLNFFASFPALACAAGRSHHRVCIFRNSNSCPIAIKHESTQLLGIVRAANEMLELGHLSSSPDPRRRSATRAGGIRCYGGNYALGISSRYLLCG